MADGQGVDSNHRAPMPRSVGGRLGPTGTGMTNGDLLLRRFEPRFARTVASWVQDADELFNLTPTTPPPLTASKVIGWSRAPGWAFLLHKRGADGPSGYGELHPMRRNEEHWWIGHVIVDPAERGRGAGCALVQKLADTGFSALAAERISLIVFPDNEAAVRCYRRAGFEPRGQEYHHFGPRRRRYRMLRFELDRPWAADRLAMANAQAPRLLGQSLPEWRDSR